MKDTEEYVYTKLIDDFMQKNGIDEIELCNRAGIDVYDLDYLYRYKKPPKDSTIRKLSKTMNVPFLHFYMENPKEFIKEINELGRKIVESLKKSKH